MQRYNFFIKGISINQEFNWKSDIKYSIFKFFDLNIILTDFCQNKHDITSFFLMVIHLINFFLSFLNLNPNCNIYRYYT